MWATTTISKMIEELVEIHEKVNEPLDLCVAFCPWKKKEEILSLLTEKESGKEEKKEP